MSFTIQVYLYLGFQTRDYFYKKITIKFCPNETKKKSKKVTFGSVLKDSLTRCFKTRVFDKMF